MTNKIITFIGEYKASIWPKLFLIALISCLIIPTTSFAQSYSQSYGFDNHKSIVTIPLAEDHEEERKFSNKLGHLTGNAITKNEESDASPTELVMDDETIVQVVTQSNNQTEVENVKSKGIFTIINEALRGSLTKK